jgi:uncharacterized damage-inducible protein DinB
LSDWVYRDWPDTSNQGALVEAITSHDATASLRHHAIKIRVRKQRRHHPGGNFRRGKIAGKSMPGTQGRKRLVANISAGGAVSRCRGPNYNFVLIFCRHKSPHLSSRESIPATIAGRTTNLGFAAAPEVSLPSNGKEHGSVTTRLSEIPSQLGKSAVHMFVANERMNQTLIEHLHPGAWKAVPPGKVRGIAAIFTHMHNVRTKWIRLTAPHLKVPLQLHRAHCTQKQARAALAESATGCIEMLADALGASEVRRIETFRRDALAPAWPVGPEMLYYMLAHEAHHRGQVCMLAHQLGYTFPHAISDGIWNWEKLWKQSGAARGPGHK